MPDETTGHTELFADYPTRAAELGRAVVASASEIEAQSRSFLLTSGARPPTGFFLTGTRFHWRVSITVSSQRQIFFFFRRKGDPKPLIHADVQFLVTPADSVLLDANRRSGTIVLSVVRPPFVVSRPSPDQRRDLIGEKATPRNSILLRVGARGQSFLGAIWLGSSPRLRYTAAPGEEPIDLRPGKAPWPVAPVVTLFETLGAWASEDFVAGEAQPFRGRQRPQGNEALGLFNTLLESYSALQTGISAERPSAHEVAFGLKTEYHLESLHARLLLRLNSVGKLASANDDHDTFQLLLHLLIKSDGPVASARLTVGPPDFLVHGAVFDAFTEAITSEAKEKDDGRLINAVRSALQASEFGDVDPATVQRFLTDVATYHSIARVRRDGDDDKNILFLKGLLTGKLVVVLLVGHFRVRTGRDLPAVEIDGDLDCEFAGDGGSPSLRLSRDVARYVGRLLTQIRYWMGTWNEQLE